MSKIKNHIHDFLESGGWELNYDWDQLPDDINDMDYIINFIYKKESWEYEENQNK